MFVLSNFIYGIAKVIAVILNIYNWLIIIRALISWVNPDPLNPIVIFLQSATEPVLRPIRKIFSFTWKIGIDISPIIAILLIYFLNIFLVRSLEQLAFRLS